MMMRCTGCSLIVIPRRRKIPLSGDHIKRYTLENRTFNIGNDVNKAVIQTIIYINKV